MGGLGLFKDCGCGCGGQKQEDKLVISIISGMTFFIVANPGYPSATLPYIDVDVVVPRREPRLLLHPQFPWRRPPTQDPNLPRVPLRL